MLDRQSMQVAVQDLTGVDPNITAAAIVSHDGLMMVSTLDDQDTNELMAAMTSEVLSKGKQTIEELELGDLHSDLLLGTDGGLMARKINDEMVLVARIRPGVNVGRVFGKMNEIVKRIGDI